MSFLIFDNSPAAHEARRSFLGKSDLLLTGATVALLARQKALAKGGQSSASDLHTLNTALGAQRAAIVDEQLHNGSTAPQTRTSKRSS